MDMVNIKCAAYPIKERVNMRLVGPRRPRGTGVKSSTRRQEMSCEVQPHVLNIALGGISPRSGFLPSKISTLHNIMTIVASSEAWKR